jgi:hypothetical protein
MGEIRDANALVPRVIESDRAIRTEADSLWAFTIAC